MKNHRSTSPQVHQSTGPPSQRDTQHSASVIQSPAHSFDPLPRHFLTKDEGTGGRIKLRPEDFLVDEQPLYQPSGEGEHLYLGIEKKNVSHVEMISALRKRFGVRERAVGFAGMKDKLGVTRQVVSIHLPKGREPNSRQPLDLAHDRIAILWAERHTNKLKRGHLAGNRFSIRIREVDPLKAPLAMRTLRTLERLGVPNFFGTQRFGYRINNHLLGAMYIAGDYQGVLGELLGTRGTPFPDYQRERRELFEAGRYEDALPLWSAADGAERSALRALAAGRDAKAVCHIISQTTRNFWIAAMQSAVFNRVVDERLAAGSIGSLGEGDLAWKHDSRSVFAVTGELARDPEIVQRLARLEISPSGPLWGTRMTRAEGEVDAAELAAFESTRLTLKHYLAAPHCPEGQRRPMREPLRNPDLESGLDEHGPYIRVAFDLPRGVYATIALREIMKTPADE